MYGLELDSGARRHSRGGFKNENSLQRYSPLPGFDGSWMGYFGRIQVIYLRKEPFTLAEDKVVGTSEDVNYFRSALACTAAMRVVTICKLSVKCWTVFWSYTSDAADEVFLWRQF